MHLPQTTSTGSQLVDLPIGRSEEALPLGKAHTI